MNVNEMKFELRPGFFLGWLMKWIGMKGFNPIPISEIKRSQEKKAATGKTSQSIRHLISIRNHSFKLIKLLTSAIEFIFMIGLLD